MTGDSYPRRMLTGPHRGHFELCAVTYGGDCDLDCLDLDVLLDELELADRLLDDVEAAELALLDELEQRPPLTALLWPAGVAAAVVAFWIVTLWLLLTL